MQNYTRNERRRWKKSLETSGKGHPWFAHWNTLARLPKPSHLVDSKIKKLKICVNTLETSGEDYKSHSKRVVKIQIPTRFECIFPLPISECSQCLFWWSEAIPQERWNPVSAYLKVRARDPFEYRGLSSPLVSSVFLHLLYSLRVYFSIFLTRFECKFVMFSTRFEFNLPLRTLVDSSVATLKRAAFFLTSAR